MKYTSAVTHIVFVASIATSTLRTGFAVPRPASKFVLPQQQRQHRKTSSQSSAPGLLVDKEGNLYSPHPRVTKNNAQEQQQRDESRTRAVCQSLRGGGDSDFDFDCDVCVDNEGNFYTPQNAKAKAKANALMSTTTTTAPKAASSYTLRGGSHNHNLGGLGVDSEGNLFATQSPLFLRGGDLSVDQEGNFYTPRVVPVPNKVPGTLAGNARRLQSSSSSGGSAQHDAVLLTKNRLSKKTASSGSSSSGKSNKPSAGDDTSMAFIGYNNALMET